MSRDEMVKLMRAAKLQKNATYEEIKTATGLTFNEVNDIVWDLGKTIEKLAIVAAYFGHEIELLPATKRTQPEDI